MEHLEYDSKLYENVIKCLAQSNHHERITPPILRKKTRNSRFERPEN